MGPRSDTSLSFDVHQHLWPEEFIARLRQRCELPHLRGWRLELPGEPETLIDPADHDVERRRTQAEEDGVAFVVLAPSSPLGLEQLSPRESLPLLEAYHDGVIELGAPFQAWAWACLSAVDAHWLEEQLARGFVGLQLPATALLDEQDYVEVEPLLRVLEGSDRPLFIHPGAVANADAPPWWSPIVAYVQQMHAAWYAFQAYGRSRHPRLRVCFALLAGLAPLHGERVRARGGPPTVVDENVFLETSSYGPRAIDATVRVLGIDVLVHGSDRPYAKPPNFDGGAADFALRCANPSRLLPAKEVSRAVAHAPGALSRPL